jgi:hypothetical protein
MIETRRQGSVAGGVDPGNSEACLVTGVQRTARPTCSAVVSARGYNLVASRTRRSQQLATTND